MTLSSDDEKDWDGLGLRGPGTGNDATKKVGRVSPNGRFVEFMSDRPLTGYDNHDALSGQLDEEVFLYDASTGRVVCASCNPTGARPTGILDTYSARPMVDRENAWGEREHEQWLAASVPASQYRYHSRDMQNDGRLFFNSSDALVPQDTNGLEDVYEYEPTGVGDCTSTSRTFSERSNGCVSLISSGQSAEESAFLDASEGGGDVFFFTSARLTGADYDAAYDVYDARICTTSEPCRMVPVSPPACSSGDSCKAAPSPQPVIFGATPSATFSGIGNVTEQTAKKTVAKHKPKRHVRKRKRRSRRGHARGQRANAHGRSTRVHTIVTDATGRGK